MRIESLKPRKTYNLSVGDIIFGEDEFIYGRYRNTEKDITDVGYKTEENCERSLEKMETMFSKGKVFQFPTKISLKSVKESRKNSIWCIDDVRHIKSFKGLHGQIPEMKIIQALQVIDGKITEDSERIDFFIIGPKNQENVINIEFEVIGKLIKDEKDEYR